MSAFLDICWACRRTAEACQRLPLAVALVYVFLRRHRQNLFVTHAALFTSRASSFHAVNAAGVNALRGWPIAASHKAALLDARIDLLRCCITLDARQACALRLKAEGHSRAITPAIRRHADSPPARTARHRRRRISAYFSFR